MNRQPKARRPADPGRVEAAAFASLRVERVERDDGRYVLYFSWPSATGDAPTVRTPQRRE